MAVWDHYPAHYRATEVQAVLRAAGAGESTVLLGLSGSGKSNLIGFLAARCAPNAFGVALARVDCNRLRGPAAGGFYALAAVALGGDAGPGEASLDSLARAVDARLSAVPKLCLLLDRFDSLLEIGPDELFGGLRALRDEHKYALTYVIASRRPLPDDNELAELFYGHILWLGPLSEEDARWSANEYALRAGMIWDAGQLEAILTLSGRYPSLLRAVCQAAAEGAALDLASLRAHPAVRARVEEFWADAPGADAIAQSGLTGHPLLGVAEAPPELTAKEQRLLDALRARAGQVCEKDALISAVWPEDLVYERGLRDDSLAQLVRRLREKVEPDPAHPRKILTVPGRGYRWIGD